MLDGRSIEYDVCAGPSWRVHAGGLARRLRGEREGAEQEKKGRTARRDD